MSFAERLKRLRKDNEMTQAELGDLLGVSGSFVSMLESGKSTPPDHLIKLLAAKFYLREEWLKTGNGPALLPYEELRKMVVRYVNALPEPARSQLQELTTRDLLFEEAKKGKFIIPMADADLEMMLSYLRKMWALGDPDIRGWLKVQFRRAFPDFEEELKKEDTAGSA